ncbi:hypothetical protein NL676_000115 [Syzygium grande]|nr:hypothetical protein NL676_000115 [Syzygium grande]
MLIQQEYEMIEKAKEISPGVIGWQIQCGRDKQIAGVGPQAGINRQGQSYLLVPAVRDDWIPLWLFQLEGMPNFRQKVERQHQVKKASRENDPKRSPGYIGIDG